MVDMVVEAKHHLATRDWKRQRSTQEARWATEKWPNILAVRLSGPGLVALHRDELPKDATVFHVEKDRRRYDIMSGEDEIVLFGDIHEIAPELLDAYAGTKPAAWIDADYCWTFRMGEQAIREHYPKILQAASEGKYERLYWTQTFCRRNDDKTARLQWLGVEFREMCHDNNYGIEAVHDSPEYGGQGRGKDQIQVMSTTFFELKHQPWRRWSKNATSAS